MYWCCPLSCVQALARRWLAQGDPAQGTVPSALSVWAVVGQCAVSVQGQGRHSLQALLLLWEVKIVAFSAMCGCCEYKHVKLYEVLR